jgi:F420-0:gamma-glutamyl ligase
MVVLYPRRPEALALQIRQALKFSLGIDVGVVVCDSRLMPTRRGTTGVALASSGLEAILDLRGKSDLFDNVLRVTSQGIADDLSSASQILMGESDEATPIVVVRGLSRSLLKDTEYASRRFSIPMAECVYLRSLGYLD